MTTEVTKIAGGHTIPLADHALLKMVKYVLLQSMRPELDGQMSCQIMESCLPTIITRTLYNNHMIRAQDSENYFWDASKVVITILIPRYQSKYSDQKYENISVLYKIVVCDVTIMQCCYDLGLNGG
jgi:hypothetical protein